MPSVETAVIAGAVHVFVIEPGTTAGALTDELLDELHAALDRACSDPACVVLIVAGRSPGFCSGMHLAGAATADRDAATLGAERFFDLMLRLTTSALTTIAAVDGRATGGGVGIAAACDIVVATPRSEFVLPEALWGLLPCCALPFVERRVGIHHAQAMSLTTLAVSASRAREMGLVDFVSERLEHALAPVLARATKLRRETVAALKAHAAGAAPITEARRAAAVSELVALVESPAVRHAVARYTHDNRFPWEP